MSIPRNEGHFPYFLKKWNIFYSIIPMPRIARVCAAGYPHPITQRGKNKEKVFFDDEDRRLDLDILQRYKNKYGIKVLAYCLMGNHVHILARSSRLLSGFHIDIFLDHCKALARSIVG